MSDSAAVPSPGTGEPAEQGNRAAVSSVVAGIPSLIFGLLSDDPAMVIVGAMLGLAAVVLGIVGLHHARLGRGARGQAIAGILTGSVSLAVMAWLLVTLVMFLSN